MIERNHSRTTSRAVSYGVLAMVVLVTAIASAGLLVGAIQSGSIRPPQRTLRIGALEIISETQILCLSGFQNPCDGPYYVATIRLSSPGNERTYTLLRTRIAPEHLPSSR